MRNFPYSLSQNPNCLFSFGYSRLVSTHWLQRQQRSVSLPLGQEGHSALMPSLINGRIRKKEEVQFIQERLQFIQERLLKFVVLERNNAC